MTRDELFEFLCALFPAFRPYWNGPDNYFRDDEDDTAHAICASFSHFFLESSKRFDAEALSRLFECIEALCVRDSGDGNSVANAVTTCFVENIAQTKAGARVRSFMGKETRRVFDAWNSGSIRPAT